MMPIKSLWYSPFSFGHLFFLTSLISVAFFNGFIPLVSVMLLHAFLNLHAWWPLIGISGLTLKSNVQVGDELLMDKVIGNSSLMKSARAAVQEYDTELPLAVAVLGCRLGINVDIAASTSTVEPAVINEDGND